SHAKYPPALSMPRLVETAFSTIPPVRFSTSTVSLQAWSRLRAGFSRLASIHLTRVGLLCVMPALYFLVLSSNFTMAARTAVNPAGVALPIRSMASPRLTPETAPLETFSRSRAAVHCERTVFQSSSFMAMPQQYVGATGTEGPGRRDPPPPAVISQAEDRRK